MHDLSKRVKAILHYEHVCRSVRRVGQLYGIGKSTVARWVRSGIEGMKVQRVSPTRRRRARKIPAIQNIISERLDRDPFTRTREFVHIVRNLAGKTVSQSTIARERTSSGYRFKVAKRSHQAQSPDPNHPFLACPNVYDGAIAVDESSFVSVDWPRRGWARPGRDVPKPAPRCRKRVSLLLAVDSHGVMEYTMKSGAFNSASYAEFLRSLPANRKIIADNVSFHKSKLARSAAEQRGQILVFTPPYCPWFNPVEYAFSVTKQAYRMSRLRSDYGFEADVEDSLNQLTPEMCSAFFRRAYDTRERCLFTT